VEIGERKHWSPTAITAPALGRSVDLGLALDGIRALLTRSWSRATVYSEADKQERWVAGDPRGQCGVSSVWLAEVLASEYSISSVFCQGSLIFGDEKAENVLEDHCWLEINNGSSEELVLDLTCGQAKGFDRDFVFDTKTVLNLQQIEYRATERIDISELSTNPVGARYEKLLFNMVSTMVAASGGWGLLATFFGESADKLGALGTDATNYSAL
jgi:hypothetical protein